MHSAPRPAPQQSLGRFGIFSHELRSEDPALQDRRRRAAAGLEDLGFGAIWLAGNSSVHHAAALAAQNYQRPYSTMVGYLDALDNAAIAVPADRRILAALGPKMLRLARDRAAGAHPAMVTPGYIEQAREVLGTGPLLAPWSPWSWKATASGHAVNGH
ncbi:hypothetical protein AB0H15_51105 [Streptomyces milbemycinicus]